MTTRRDVLRGAVEVAAAASLPAGVSAATERAASTVLWTVGRLGIAKPGADLTQMKEGQEPSVLLRVDLPEGMVTETPVAMTQATHVVPLPDGTLVLYGATYGQLWHLAPKGNILWEFKLAEGERFSSPPVVTAAGLLVASSPADAKTPGRLHAIDVATHTTVRTLELPGLYPVALAVSPDGAQLMVVNRGGPLGQPNDLFYTLIRPSVTVVDLTAWAVRHDTETRPLAPHGAPVFVATNGREALIGLNQFMTDRFRLGRDVDAYEALKRIDELYTQVGVPERDFPVLFRGTIDPIADLALPLLRLDVASGALSVVDTPGVTPRHVTSVVYHPGMKVFAVNLLSTDVCLIFDPAWAMTVLPRNDLLVRHLGALVPVSDTSVLVMARREGFVVYDIAQKKRTARVNVELYGAVAGAAV